MEVIDRGVTMSDDADEQVAYSEAIDELETILEEIEDDDVDLDDLADKVERASELVAICRDKIDDTEMQVQSIIDDLRAEDDESAL
jgi:exodeoxyribonuclease VII small subunit